jgi:glycosyltransferase involved in cell wall biosynthesis
MRLIIQIPCLDEEDSLPLTLSELPRQVPGFDEVEWLVIDDGSSDRTVDVAVAHGVDHVVRLANHKGLAAAFGAGIDTALKLGADVIVNTDADHQYRAQDIPELVRPILAGEADMVVGDRRGDTAEAFAGSKRLLQRLGSWVVRRASRTQIPDTTSGFRAYNREAALQLQVVSTFSYTLETVIQAGKLLIATAHVPVGTNPVTRPSRLARSTGAYVRRGGLDVFRIWAQYEPLRLFWTAAALLALPAVVLFVRFAVFFVSGEGSGHVQSLVFGAVLFNVAAVLAALGVIGDLLATQRLLTQRTLERVRRVELELGAAPSHHEGTEAAA